MTDQNNIKIRIKGKDILNHFDYYQWVMGDCHDLFNPTNKNIVEFVKYISGWGDWKNDYYFSGHDTDFIIEEIPNFVKRKLKKVNNCIREHAFIEFSFPDEETAFYFKLKFDC